MGKKKNHTDRAFQRSLKHYHAVPPTDVWNGIAGTLDRIRKKNRLIWVGRIAASVAFLIAAAGIWMLVERSPEKEMARSETAAPPTEQEAQGTESAAEITDRAGNGQVSEEQEQAVAGRQEPATTRAEETVSGTGPAGPPGTDEETGPVFESETATEAESLPETGIQAEAGHPSKTVPPGSSATYLAESISPVNNRDITRLPGGGTGTFLQPALRTRTSQAATSGSGIDVFEEFGDKGFRDYDKWSIGGQISPIYTYRNIESTTQNAPAAGIFNDLENGILSYAGGVNLNYFPVKRLSIQSGIYYSRMGLAVENNYLASVDEEIRQVNFAQNAQLNSSGQIQLGGVKTDAIADQFNPPRKEDYWGPVASNEPTELFEASEGEILQHFEYLEIPMILRYRLVDRRVGLNLLGGVSTNFLVGRNVYFQEGDNRNYIGRTEDLKSVNYSSVLGLGLQYSIRDHFYISLEPTFRYYLNSINTGTLIDSHPYSLGFFTGISYSF